MARYPEQVDDKLNEVLERSRQLGFFGPAPIAEQAEHALIFADPLNVSTEGGSDAFRAIDIGAGGGLPSLPLLVENKKLDITMLDTNERRCSFLTWAVSELGLADRARVIHGRAEVVAQDPQHRETYDAVIARGFGPPSATLECAAGLVTIGGLVVVSEPPGGRQWELHAEALEQLGLDVPKVTRTAVFAKSSAIGDSFPRNWRSIQSHPLFEL